MTDNNNKIYINKKGKQVMRVTEIIKTLSKEQIVFWANMLGFKRISYTKELERVANIGSMVHSLIERYLDPKQLAYFNFEEFGIYSERDKGMALNALLSFTKWYKKNKKRYKVKHMEIQLTNDYMGGTSDCIIESIFNKDHVIISDYKTSSEFYLTQFLQLCGYIILYEEEFGENAVDGIMIILLDKKDGNEAQARFIPRDKLSEYLNVFKYLVNTAIGVRSLEKRLSNDMINF